MFRVILRKIQENSASESIPANPFSLLTPKLRKVLAEFFREARGRDRDPSKGKHSWISQERGLREYCYELNVPLPNLLREIGGLLEGESRILDVGVGRGKFLRELGFQFHDRLHLEGLSLTRQTPKGMPNYRQRIGCIETYPLETLRYDRIFSVRGGLAYSLDQFGTFQKLFNGLKSGGVAYLESSKFLLDQAWFRQRLEKALIEVSVLKKLEGKAVAFRIARNSVSSLDLGEFSRKYFMLLQEREDTFLRLGFDRLKQPEDLEKEFYGLYSESNYPEL